MSCWDIFNSFDIDNNYKLNDNDNDNDNDNTTLNINDNTKLNVHTNNTKLKNIDNINDRNSDVKKVDDLENICYNCDNKVKFIYDSGAYYCGTCGTFIKKILNQKYQYNDFYDDNNHNPCRVGSGTNILLPKSSLGSIISNKNKNYNYNKMAKYNSWNAMPYKERSQWKIFTLITEVCNKHKLPKIIIEDSKIYYKHISENVISRGTNRKGLIAACVYNSFKKQKVPRSCKEIAEIFNIELKDMTKGCKNFNEIW